MKKLGLVLFVLLSVSSYACSQILAAHEMNRIDSLIFLMKFEQVSQFIRMKDSEIKNINFSKEDFEEYEAIKSSLIKLIQLINSLNLRNDHDINLLIEQNKKFSSNYTENYVGQRAAEAYRKFLILSDQNEKIKALKYYQIARYFKNNHFIMNKKKIEKLLRFAETLYSQRKYSEAHKIIQVITPLIENYSVYSHYLEPYRFLKEKIENKVHSDRINKKFWGQTGINPYFSVISISVHSILIDKINEHTILESHYAPEISSAHYINIHPEDETLYAKQIRTNYTVGLSLDAKFKIQKRMQLGIRFGFGQYTRNFISENTWSFKYKVDYWSAELNGYYFLREEIGLRPYIGLGLGVSDFKPKATVVPGVVMNQLLEHVFYTLARENDTLQNMIIEFGTEYISSPRSKLLYKFSLPVYLYSKEPEYVGRINFGVRLSVGYAI